MNDLSWEAAENLTNQDLGEIESEETSPDWWYWCGWCDALRDLWDDHTKDEYHYEMGWEDCVSHHNLDNHSH